MIGLASSRSGWPSIATHICATPQRSSSTRQWSQDASSAAPTSRRCSPRMRRNGAVSMERPMTTGRCVFRTWRSSRRLIQGMCSAKDMQRNTKAGHSDMHTATCRSRVLQQRGSRHICRPVSLIVTPTSTRTATTQRHCFLVLQSTVVTTTLAGLMLQLSMRPMKMGR